MQVFLAIYSGWTFLGMFTTLQRTISSFSCSSGGFASTIDSLCKIHGTSGLGNGAFYDPEASAWTSHNPAALLLTNHGTPSAAQSGRLWNEGLSYFGFWFYLSKFYEVLDTFIILAKGKRSQTLQTYHHAGAMMCMWAGIRYMSPPIWMFVFVNSFIHTVMVSLVLCCHLKLGRSELTRSLTVHLFHCHRFLNQGPAHYQELSHHSSNHPIPRRIIIRGTAFFCNLQCTSPDPIR